MFSSAQIEYIQYWLHATKLTREPIALPSSEFLILESDLQHVSPVIYKNGQEFKKAQKVVTVAKLFEVTKPDLERYSPGPREEQQKAERNFDAARRASFDL
jgi:hypothetical protein